VAAGGRVTARPRRAAGHGARSPERPSGGPGAGRTDDLCLGRRFDASGGHRNAVDVVCRISSSRSVVPSAVVGSARTVNVGSTPGDVLRYVSSGIPLDVMTAAAPSVDTSGSADPVVGKSATTATATGSPGREPCGCSTSDLAAAGLKRDTSRPDVPVMAPDPLAPATSEDETADLVVRRGRNVGGTWIVASVVLFGLCLVATSITLAVPALAGSILLLVTGLRARANYWRSARRQLGDATVRRAQWRSATRDRGSPDRIMIAIGVVLVLLAFQAWRP